MFLLCFFFFSSFVCVFRESVFAPLPIIRSRNRSIMLMRVRARFFCVYLYLGLYNVSMYKGREKEPTACKLLLMTESLLWLFSMYSGWWFLRGRQELMISKCVPSNNIPHSYKTDIHTINAGCQSMSVNSKCCYFLLPLLRSILVSTYHIDSTRLAFIIFLFHPAFCLFTHFSMLYIESRWAKSICRFRLLYVFLALFAKWMNFWITNFNQSCVLNRRTIKTVDFLFSFRI